MKVSRDFEEVYRSENDPWAINDASGERYKIYVSMLMETLRDAGAKRLSCIDIGGGFGDFSNRVKKALVEFGVDLDVVVVDISSIATEKGKLKHPDMRHVALDCTKETSIGQDPLTLESYDLIVCSDMLYYVEDAAKAMLVNLFWKMLKPSGMLFAAAWCPGGKYMRSNEFKEIFSKGFLLMEEKVFPSEHLALCLSKIALNAIVTIDYETWQPVPEGKEVDWEKDVFEPSEKLAAASEECSVRITFMVNVPELLWLERHRPEVFGKAERQLKDLSRRGHDLQLHFHPAWVLGRNEKELSPDWMGSFLHATALDVDLSDEFSKCCEFLNSCSLPGHKVVAFRAGGYQVQPFKKIADALVRNGIEIDSSVFDGGVSKERGFDFSHVWGLPFEPYYCSECDPCVLAPPNEKKLIEVCIAAKAGQRASLDGSCILGTSRMLSDFAKGAEALPARWRLKRLGEWLSAKRQGAMSLLIGSRLRSLLPMSWIWDCHHEKRPSKSSRNKFFVMIGHTKESIDLERFKEMVSSAVSRGVKFATLSSAADSIKSAAKESFLFEGVPPSKELEAKRQVEREREAILGDDRNWQQSHHLQEMMSSRRFENVLDFGCGSGYWSLRLATFQNIGNVWGIDYGGDFVRKAIERRSRSLVAEKVRFLQADFTMLPFPSDSFDAVYADNTLEHSFDLTETLREIARVLKRNGMLFAAFPPDSLGGRKYVCSNHTWKTNSVEARCRLESIGFKIVSMVELDLVSQLGASPFAPSENRMIYVVATIE